MDSRYAEERIQNRFSYKTQPNNSSCGILATTVNREETSVNGSSTGTSREGCNRVGLQSHFTRVLQPLVCRTEEGEREVAFHSQFDKSKQICQERKVQNGNGRDHQGHASTGRVDNIFRPVRCILPHSDPSDSQEVFSFHSSGQGVSVSRFAHGPLFVPTSLHSSHQMPQTICTEVSHNPTPVFRRLAGEGKKSTDISSAYSVHSTDRAGPRSVDKLGQVRNDTITTDRVSRISTVPRYRDSVTNARQMGENSANSSIVPQQQGIASVRMAKSFRSSHRNGEDGSVGDAASQTYSMGAVGSVEPVPGRSTAEGDNFTRGERSFELVASEGKCVKRSSFQNEGIGNSDLHGCYTPRMGGASRREGSGGTMDFQGREIAYKCAGATRCTADTSTVSRTDSRQDCSSSVRQYCSSRLPEESGGDTFTTSHEISTRDLHVVGVTSSDTEMSAYSRTTQRPRRQVVEGGRDNTNRVVTTPSDSTVPVEFMGQANVGSVCHQVEPQVANLCVTGAGCRGVCCRRAINAVERDLRICLPADSDSTQGIDKVGRTGGVHPGDDSPFVAPSDMVSDTIGSANRHASSTASNSQNAETAPVQHLPQPTGELQTSCVAIIAESLQKKGFSEKASLRMAKAQKDSSLAVYQSKWDCFRDWCSKQHANPVKASMGLVADFLVYLHEDKKLAYSTIEGYRAAIGHMIKAVQGVDIGADLNISSLLANFARDKPKRKTSAPVWDLSLVLQAFTEPPFEPFDQAKIKLVTFKTVFLITLALGARRSEIHALRQDNIMRDETWSKVTLQTDPEFVSKTELANKGAAVLKPIVLHSLGETLGPEMDEDLSLCPVRALRMYLDRTAEFRGQQKKLFISFKKGYQKEICKNTISFWIKKTILLAYNQASGDTLRLFGVKAHDVRAMAASWAFTRNIALENILSACQWKTHNTFTHHYLKNLTMIADKMLKLGPVVVAKHTV